MARTINEIYNEMIVEKQSYSELGNLNSNSNAALWRLIFYIVAFAIWVLENLFDTHKSEVLRIIETMKPHTSAWYGTMAKAFQFGFDLLPYSDKFDNAGHTEDEIEASKIVKYAAVIEREINLQIKVAKFAGSDLSELSEAELASFTTYINRVKDAGVKINILSLPAENLKIELDIYYNPLVLNSYGERIDGTLLAPVADAVKNYIANIEFDGTYITASMVDVLQKVYGIEIPHIVSQAYRYGELDWTTFDVMHRPLSGYLKIDDGDLVINYIPR